jgi:hypothetical protein
MVALTLCAPICAIAQQASDIPLPARAPIIPETPEMRPENIGSPDWPVEKEEQHETEGEEEEAAEEEEDHEPPIPVHAPHTVKPGAKTASEPLGPEIQPEEWSEAKVTAALKQCENLLSKAIYDYEPLAPIRKGVCGTPAPIELGSVEALRTVTIRPAAKVNCTMASAFHRWMVETVQPSARNLLETEITGVINVASYHCRTRYGDPNQRMSQHAFANALDLAGFITAKGEQISVEKSWEGDTPQSRFLQHIHAEACNIFGTVLGPKANAAHKNHFHLDMTKRRHGSYCR